MRLSGARVPKDQRLKDSEIHKRDQSRNSRHAPALSIPGRAKGSCDILIIAFSGARSVAEFENTNEAKIIRFLENEFVIRKLVCLKNKGLFHVAGFIARVSYNLLFGQYRVAYFTNTYGGLFYLLAKLRGRKTVVEAEDVYPVYLNYKRFAGFSGRMDYIVKRLFCRIAAGVDLVIAKYEAIARSIAGFCPGKCNVKIIRFKLDQIFINTGHRKKEGAEKVVFGYWGNLKDIKTEGLIKFLEALSKSKQAQSSQFLIVGGPEEEILKLKNFNRCELETPGYVYPPELSSYLEGIDCFVFPMNGLNNKIYEALALGLPVIAPFGSLEELKKLGYFIFCEDSVRGYETAVETFIAERNGLDYENNRKLFLDNYSDPLDLYKEIFRQLIAGSGF